MKKEKVIKSTYLALSYKRGGKKKQLHYTCMPLKGFGVDKLLLNCSYKNFHSAKKKKQN